MLSRELRQAWDQATVPRQASTSGPAGTIHGQAQIRSLLDWWREHIGSDVKASISWDRTGAQAFPLLARGDWSAQALFGKSGRIELSAIGAKDLLIECIGFGYRIAGDDISFDLDPVTFKGLALRLGPVPPTGSAVPSEFPV